MAVVFFWTDYAGKNESNLWPIVMILTSPVAALIVVLCPACDRLNLILRTVEVSRDRV
jgi:hypothetical protein